MIGGALLSLAVSNLRAEAQWPQEKTVHLIVPYAAGGIGDVVARLLAKRVGATINRNIIVEPRPGGGTVIATEAVSRSPPDGATLLLVANSFLINAHVKANLPYEPLISFAPICLLAQSPQILVVRTNSGYRSLAQFIEAGQAHKGQISVGATGPNSSQHMTVEALRQAANADWRFVPFKGAPPAVSNLLGGHITAVLANYADVKEHLGGVLRPLAVGSRERLAELPDVPTLSEAGFTDVDAISWIGLVLPAKTPEQATAQIAAHFKTALDAPEVRAKLRALRLAPSGLCGKDFASYLRRQHERLARIVKAAGIKGR
jgi:tripartite-type tricarboxylate transporter receptor subunit TctC